MLRLEGLIDFKLQAALIDRLLKLPAGLFRNYTTGDLVDRAMGIDAIRRILTGRTLRGFMSLLFCIFSVGLMLYYDLSSARSPWLLTLVRAVVIIGTSALRVYYENRHFNLQGKTGGLVLQLIAGVGKLRVANATAPRAGAVVAAVCGAEELFHRLPAGRQLARRVRDVLSDAGDAGHLWRWPPTPTAGCCSISARSSASIRRSARPWARSGPGPRASANRSSPFRI